MEVQAHRKLDYADCTNPGDFYWSPAENPSRISFLCPCGCGDLAGCSVKGASPWEWNGDKDNPTLQPSILINRGHWHGYLTNGVFRKC